IPARAFALAGCTRTLTILLPRQSGGDQAQRTLPCRRCALARRRTATGQAGCLRCAVSDRRRLSSAAPAHPAPPLVHRTSRATTAGAIHTPERHTLLGQTW